MSAVSLDFVVYVGDPENGAEAIPSVWLVKDAARYKEHLRFSDVVYGAITIKKGSTDLAEVKIDPILGLVTQFVRALPYVIDGEAETALLSESEHGFLFEPSSGDDMLLSFFAGDAYEPDEYLVEHESIKLEHFCEQVVGMAERLTALMKQGDPEHFDTDDYSKSFREFLEIGRAAFKTYKLERERGVRR